MFVVTEMNSTPLRLNDIETRIIFNTPEDGVAVQPNATVTLCEIDTTKLSRIAIIIYTKIALSKQYLKLPHMQQKIYQ
jgi:hypothetical protein